MKRTTDNACLFVVVFFFATRTATKQSFKSTIREKYTASLSYQSQCEYLLRNIIINSRTYAQIHTPTVVQGGWGGGVDGTLELLMCCSILKRFYLQWKALDLFNKMRYFVWVVALLEACDVTNNGRHLLLHSWRHFHISQNSSKFGLQ